MGWRWVEAALPLGIIAGMLCIAGNVQYVIHTKAHGRPKHIGNDMSNVLSASSNYRGQGQLRVSRLQLPYLVKKQMNLLLVCYSFAGLGDPNATVDVAVTKSPWSQSDPNINFKLQSEESTPQYDDDHWKRLSMVTRKKGTAQMEILTGTVLHVSCYRGCDSLTPELDTTTTTTMHMHTDRSMCACDWIFFTIFCQQNGLSIGLLGLV
ncbi:hypothetical protein DKX38_006798 [Salix brachista]|uniref:NADH dehydrogenase [ubiquinone] 1 alpha subcomplex subunit 1 n=1 Tax=Salix brachista TaxID=2182728 RepID=A0A5N5N5P2_9ROSI|nr:hypothetical protein DKX38_006798 [Salix brachista]